MSFFLSALLSFVICFAMTKFWILMSQKRALFQAIREEGPAKHKTAKQHIPTMGGIAIVVSVLLTTSPSWNVRLWILLGTMLACGLLGFADDLLKILRGKNLGLKARHKFFWQVIIGLALGVALQKTGVGSQFKIPGFGAWDAGIFFLPFVVLVLMGTSNAVNLTDGLDGLAAGVAITVAVFFFFISMVMNPDPTPAYFCASLIGALLAFLWFNGHPAKIFMGDVGSLAIGGALAALAFQTRLVFWLPIAGGIFVAETLSVILQVIYFKLTGGKRIFKMSPLHHHFELSGVPETQVTLRFWIVSALLFWLSVLGASTGY